MEDSHAIVLDMYADLEQREPKDGPGTVSFFGVYDGHGGDKVALYAGERVHHIVAQTKAFKAGNYGLALKKGFLATDEAIFSSRSNA
jgi:protein phosphatase 2C family protein 2/3